MYSNSLATSGYSDALPSTTSPSNAATQCLGGYISRGVWHGTTLNDLFGNITGDQNVAKSTDYRAIFFYNADPSLTLSNVWVWIVSQTTGGAVLQLGVDPTPASALASTLQQAVIIPTPYSAPTGVTFIAAASKATGIFLGSVPAGQVRCFWIQRKAQDGSPLNLDTTIIRVEGDTPQ